MELKQFNKTFPRSIFWDQSLVESMHITHRVTINGRRISYTPTKNKKKTARAL